jgi:pimeloyl-ACP methyl ester carboxylesterase
VTRLLAMPRERTVERLGPIDWPAEELELWSHAKHAMDPAVMATLSRHGEPVFRRRQLRRDDPQVPCPVTAVFGSQEPSEPTVRRMTEALAGRTPALQVVELSTGHNVRREDPEAFAALLLRVLDSVAARVAGEADGSPAGQQM